MDKYLKQTATTDFIKYGFEPEFIGRLPVRVACESLTKEDLARILTSSEGSILRQYHLDFKGYGIDFDITDEAIQEVAGQASKERTGARGLLTVLEKVFRDFKFNLPSTGIKSFEVTTDTIVDPEPSLVKMLKDNQHLQQDVLRQDLTRFTESFGRDYGLAIEFDEAATEALIEASIKEDVTIRSVCEERFKDFQHGLQIVSRNTGKTHFVIDKKAAENPDGQLSDWVVASFKEKKEKEEAHKKDTQEDTDV